MPEKCTVAGIICGVSKGLLWFLLSDFISSDWSHDPHSNILVAACVYILLVGVLLLLCMAKWKPCRPFVMYGYTQLLFLCFAVLSFVNKLTVRLHIFPISGNDDNNALGIIMLFAFGLALVIGELIHLGITAAYSLKIRGQRDSPLS